MGELNMIFETVNSFIGNLLGFMFLAMGLVILLPAIWIKLIELVNMHKNPDPSKINNNWFGGADVIVINPKVSKFEGLMRKYRPALVFLKRVAINILFVLDLTFVYSALRLRELLIAHQTSAFLWISLSIGIYGILYGLVPIFKEASLQKSLRGYPLIMGGFVTLINGIFLYLNK